MKRIVLYLVAFGVLLYVVNAIAPLLIIGVAGLVLMAWKRPDTVERLAARPQLAAVPAPVRASPMRFAGTVGFAAFVLIALSAPFSAAGRDGEAAPTPAPRADAGGEWAPAETPEPTQRSTPEPTQRATPEPTRRPTPEPTPQPTLEPTPELGSQPTGPTQVGTVVNVVDGDTIDVLVDGVEVRVRYIGMDTPEVHSGVEWLGPEAAAANADLVLGKEVVLEKDVSETDRYGRALRYVWVDGADGWLLVNLELIRLGFASITTYPPDVKYVDALYVAAQDEAQAAGIGVWGAAPTPVPTPAPTPVPAAAAPVPLVPQPGCEPSYPDPGVCIPVGAADLDCGEIAWRRFTVLWNVPNPDPHGFDREGDGIGCES